MSYFTGLVLLLVASAIVNNVVLSQFLGLCPFLGVSKRVETAAGMGGAVIFVITIASFVASLIYKFILAPTGFEYMQTIVFILVIAALVADGESVVDDITYIERGYEDFDQKLAGLGANIVRVASERELKMSRLKLVE